MKFSKEAIEEAAKLSKMSVGDYLDKLPSSFYEEAAKQSGFSNQEYLGKLKSIYSEPLKKKEDTQFGGTASANGTQNTSQSTSSSVLPSKNVSTPTNNIGQKIFNVNQAVQDLVYEKEDKPFFEKAKEPTPQVPLKQEQLKKKETPKEESRLVKVWSPTEKAYIYKLKEVQQSTSPESVVSVMTTQQILDATPETVKFRVNQGKNQEQLSFEQQSDKNNNVQAFNRESKYYTTYSKEIGKRIEDSEKVIKDKLGADFLGKLTKTSMSLNQTIATFNEYQKDKEKRANQLQTELTSIATKVKNGTLSKSDADYDFNLKREELEQIQNDLNQRVQNIKTIQDQLESYKNIPEVKSYILLNEKQNKVNEEARGLIFKDEYSEYRKTLDIASQKQFEKDTQKKEFLDKGFFGKVSDVLGAISNLSPVVLAEKLITGNKDKTYTGTAIKDESHRLMARTLNAIASYPKMAENTNPFGKADKYDFFDKIFDATTEFSKEKELTNQNASDVQRDIKQKYVEVDGYRVLLDDKGKPTKVTDDRFFNIGGLTQSLIINKYENNKDKYKDVKSDISVGTAVAKSVPTILDMGGLIALTTLTGGATAPLLGTEIAYGAATVASAAAQMYSGLYEGGIEAGLSPTEAGDFATVASLGVGSVSLVNPMEMSIAKNLMTRKVGKEIAEKMTKSEIQLVLNGKLKVTDLAIKYGKDYIKNTAGENLEEIVLEPFVQRGVEVLYNENAKKQGSGFEDLNEPFFNAKEVAETAIITSISTLLFSPIETASSIPNEKRLAVFKAIEKPNEFTEALNDKLEKGDITKERYDFEVKALEDVSNQYNSVKDNIKEKDKEKLTELLAKKYNLKKEISKINDDVLNRRNKSLLEDINKEIEGIITPKEATQEEENTEEENEEVSSGVEGDVKLETGNKIQWNVFGNEESGEWTVGEKTKTRAGKDAVVLTKTYVESSKDGKSYTKEYADANGIKYDNEYTVEHIVSLEDLQKEQSLPTKEVKDNAKPTISKEQTEPTKKLAEGVSSNSNEGVNPALKDVESTAKALEGVDVVQHLRDKTNALRDEQGNIPKDKMEKFKALRKASGAVNDGLVQIPESNYENTGRSKKFTPKQISEAYHKAKEDGSNPELVKAVEQSLKETTKAETVTETIQEKGIEEAGSVGGDVKLEGYHYTDKDFTEFEQPTETQSLGNGTYFYLNKRKSTKREVTSELNVKKVLDWKELKDEERDTIIKELEKSKIPIDRLNDGKLVRKAFSNIDEAKKFSSDKRAEGLNVKTDLVDGEYIVEYKEKGVSNASNDKLRQLAAEFDPNIAKRLGYDAAKLGDEIVVFDIKNTKIKPTEQPLKETTKAESNVEEGSGGVGGDGKKITITGYRNKGSKDVESSTTDESEVKSKETDKQELKLVLNNLKIVEDENENEFANSKLTGESEIEQEPNVKAIENEGENVTNPEQAEKVLGKINDLTNNALDVVSVPISEIKTNEEEYQGRNNAFSERSAENVSKHFDKNKFNPIVVYQHPNGNIYVLSGHSRLEGFKRRGEKNIPATFFEGTPEQAKDFALKSNKLGTLQTDLENAEYYRKEREKGRSYNSLLSEAEQNEQKGTAKKIISLSYLNPKGKTIGALKSLEGSEGDSNSNLQVIGQKIGFIRSRNPHLTDAHENELFEYMIKDKDNIPTEREILDDNSKLNRNIASVKFDNNLPLNLSEIKIKSDARVEWEKERDDLKAKITELNKQVKPDIKTGWTGLKKEFIERIASLNNITDKEQSIQKAEEDFNNDVNKYNSIYNNQLSKRKIELKALQDKLAKHLLKESSVIGAEKNQPSLFGGTESTPIETKQKQEVINKLRDVAEDIDNQGSLFSSTLPNSLKSKALNKVADDIEAGLSVEQAIDKTVKELATKEQSQSLKDFINDVINDNYTSQQGSKESTTRVTPNVSIEQQIEDFGIQDKGMIKAVSSVVQSLFNSLKKAGLVLHDNVEDWLGIGKSSLVDEKALKQIKDKAIKNGTFMKAPNGKPTNLNERQWLQVRTEQFKKWFGDFETLFNNDYLPNFGIFNNIYGKEKLQRLSEESERGRQESGSINAIATIITQRVQKSIQEEQGISRANAYSKTKQLEEQALTKYAKENGLIVALPSGDVVSDGNESDVYLNDNPNKVTKVTIPNNYNSWLELFDSIAIHNAENPNTQYEIKGFAINKDGEFSVVLEQNTIQGTPANFADIHNDLLNKGYELSGEYGDGRYIHKDKGIVLEDVKEDNVFTDGKNLFYIDTDYYPFDKQRGGDVKVGEAKLPIDESKVSKVVDENGEPLVVYHATNANFTEFKNQGDSGFFFSDSNDDIGHYGTNTMGVFINAPLLNMNTQVPYEFNKKGEITDDSFSYNNDVNNKYFSDIEAKKDTHKKSFNENNKQFTQYVIFNPNQIKSATDNVGTFSSESNNILFQQANAQFRIKSGQRIIEALKDFIKNPNKGVSAIIHEFMHPTVVEVFNGAKNGNKVGLRHANTIISEYNKAKGTNVTLEEMLSDNDKFINGTTTSKYRDVQEFIAESWEKYHYEGAKGFNKAFQQVLDAISRAFKEVYSNLTGIEVTPELRNMFDELLGKEVVEEIEQEKVEETTPTKETTKEQPTSKEETKVVSGKYNILERGKELVTEEQQSRTSKRANEAGVSDNKIATEKKDDSKFQSLASKIVDEALKNNNDDLLATVEDLKEQIEVEEINNLNLDTTTPSFNTLKVKIYGELLARAVALDDEVAKERIMDLYSKTLSSFGSGLGASSNDIMSNIKILDEIDYKVKQEQEVLLNLRTASGKTISDEISDIIGGLSKDVSDLINKALNETDSKINKAVNDIVAENKKETEPKKTFIPKDKKGKELIKSAFDELKKLYGGGNKLSFAIDLKRVAEEQFKVHKKTVQLLVQIGKGLIQEGVATIQNISDKIRDYIGRELGNAINFDDFKNEVLEKLNKQNKEKSIKSSNSEKLAEAIYNHNNKKDKPNKDKDIKEKIAEALILKYKADNKQGKPKSNRDILKEIAERVLNNDIADKLWDEAYIIASNKIDSDINLSEEEKQSQKDDLKEYIAKSKGSPFRDSEVREIVRNKFATDKDALRVKIRELAVSHFDDVNAEADSFVSRLMDETGLSYNQAETLFNAIKNEVKEIVARKAEQSLKAKDKRINDAKNNSKVKAEKPKTKIDNIVNDILRFGNVPQSRQGNYTSVLQHYGIPISNATAIRNLQQLAVIINSTSGVTQQNAQVVFQQILGQLEESPLARSKVFWNTLQNGFLANILGRGSVAIKSLFSTYIAGNWFRLQQSIVDLFSNYNGKVGLTDRVRFAFGNQRINKKVLDKLKNGFTDENGNFVMPSNQSQRSTNVLSRIANLFDVILRGNPQAKVWYEEADGMVEKELGSVFKDWKFSNALKKIYTLSMAMPVMLVRSLGAGDLFVREGVYNAQLSRIKGKEILKSGVKYGSKEYYEKLLVSLVQTEEVQNEITDIINKEEQALNRAGITMSEADKRRRRRELEAEKIGVESEVARIREEESIIAGMVSPMSEGLIKMLMTIQLAEFQKKIEGKRPDEIKASTIAIYNTLRLWNLFAKTLVPIVNIVTKSYIYGLKHVPIVGVGVHFTDKKVAQMIQKENYIEDKSDVSRMFVRQMLGLGVSSMLMSLLFEGGDDDEEEDGMLLNLQNKDVIFWGGYDKELAQNYPDKFRPNSLYYKGKLISFRDNPITLLLYPIGQITNSIMKRDMYKNNPNSDGTPSDKYLQEREKTKGNGIERYIKSVLWNVPLYFKEMGTMQGIRDVLDILMGDEDWKIERAINKVTTAPFKATPLHSGLYTDIIDMQEEKSDYASSKDFTQNWSNYLVQNSVFQNATKIPDKLDILGNKIYKQYDLSPIVTDFDFMFSYKELPKEMKDVYDYASKNNIYLGGRSIKGYFNYEVKEAMKKEETAKLLKDLYKKTEGNIPNDANFENAVKVLLRNELKVRYGKFLEEYVKNKQYENLPIEMQQENVLSALKDIKDMVWIEKGISTD